MPSNCVHFKIASTLFWHTSPSANFQHVKILHLTLSRCEQCAFISYCTASHRIEFNIHSLQLFVSIPVSALSPLWSSGQKCPSAIFANRWVNRSGNRREKKTEWKCDGTKKKKKTVVNDVLITLVSLSNFLHTMNCLVHPNSQQKRKTTTPSTMTSTFVFEVTSAQRLHCWSVDNLLILTYGCNDVDFYRKINTATIGTQSILPSHRRRPN